jgi:hypothetical protein
MYVQDISEKKEQIPSTPTELQIVSFVPASSLLDNTVKNSVEVHATNVEPGSAMYKLRLAHGAVAYQAMLDGVGLSLADRYNASVYKAYLAEQKTRALRVQRELKREREKKKKLLELQRQTKVELEAAQHHATIDVQLRFLEDMTLEEIEAKYPKAFTELLIACTLDGCSSVVDYWKKKEPKLGRVECLSEITRHCKEMETAPVYTPTEGASKRTVEEPVATSCALAIIEEHPCAVGI